MKLSKKQEAILAMIAADGNADGLYCETGGCNPRCAQANADRALDALERRGLVRLGEDCWELTDAGRARTGTQSAR